MLGELDYQLIIHLWIGAVFGLKDELGKGYFGNSTVLQFYSFNFFQQIELTPKKMNTDIGIQ